MPAIIISDIINAPRHRLAILIVALQNGFSKLKAHIRKAAARTVEALDVAVANALKTFQPHECATFFAHAGYDLD